MIRCSTCGASNPDGAAWCGQCLTRLDAPVEASPQTPTTTTNTTAPAASPEASKPAAPSPAADDTAPADPGSEAAADASTDTAAETSTLGFRKRPDGEVEWACTSCGEFNPIGVDACAVCGTPFSARWAEPEAPPPPPEVFRTALQYSALLPGAGHIHLKRTGSGVLRILLFLSWMLGAAVIIASGGPVLLTSAPLLLGALGVYALSLADITRLRDGRPELLRGRLAVWGVAGIIGLEILALLAASVSLGGPQ